MNKMALTASVPCDPELFEALRASGVPREQWMDLMLELFEMMRDSHPELKRYHFSYADIGAFCGCSKQNIELVQRRACAKMHRAARKRGFR